MHSVLSRILRQRPGSTPSSGCSLRPCATQFLKNYLLTVMLRCQVRCSSVRPEASSMASGVLRFSQNRFECLLLQKRDTVKASPVKIHFDTPAYLRYPVQYPMRAIVLPAVPLAGVPARRVQPRLKACSHRHRTSAAIVHACSQILRPRAAI